MAELRVPRGRKAEAVYWKAANGERSARRGDHLVALGLREKPSSLVRF